MASGDSFQAWGISLLQGAVPSIGSVISLADVPGLTSGSGVTLSCLERLAIESPDQLEAPDEWLV